MKIGAFRFDMKAEIGKGPTFVDSALKILENEMDLGHAIGVTDSLDDWIDAWHGGATPEGVELYEYLGFTEAEYGSFVKDPKYVYDILRHRMRMRDRPSFTEVYMSLALTMARRSTCSRMSVGCVITSIDFRKVYAVGYNGNASGLGNVCDGTEPGQCGCLHAEENAVINCDVPRHRSKIVFCTHLPCVMCAKRLINLGGVIGVYYENDYRIRDAIELLDKVGIETTHTGSL